MAKHWDEDQKYLLKALVDYRNFIEGKDEREAKRLTAIFAETIHRNTPELQHRTVQSIVERLPYLDNLLAGVFTKENYAKKDRHLFEKETRQDGNKNFNKCNTRHSYNGAIR